MARLAASVEYTPDDDNAAFRALGGYIGVFGAPRNDGSTSIAMTAPTVMETDGGGGHGDLHDGADRDGGRRRRGR